MASVEVQRLIERDDELARDLVGLLGGVDVLQYHGELVPAQARDGVLVADGLLQARRRGAQDAVAGGVAERVVDVLEAVQIEEQHRDTRAVAPRPYDGARQPLRQQRAVRQAGERVVVGQVAQFLLGAFLIGDVRQHGDIMAALAACVLHAAGLQPAQQLGAVLALLPDLARPHAVAIELGAHAEVVLGVVLVAVEQAGGAADHLGVAVAGHAREGGVDRHEHEVAIEHHHRLGHAAQDFAGHPAFALGAAVGGDVAGGTGHAQGAAIDVAFHHAPARAYPAPLVIGVAQAQLGQEQRRITAQVLAQCVQHARQVVGVDLVAGVGLGLDTDFRRLCAAVVHAHAVQGAVGKVVVPELLARRPQRQLQALFAFADLLEIAALALAALAPPPAQHQHQRDPGEGRCGDRQGMAPERRLDPDRNAQFLPGPRAVAVGGLGAEGVVAGGQMGVGDVLLAAVVDPALVEAIQPVAVTQVRGGGEIQRAHPQPQDFRLVGHFQRRGLPQSAGVTRRIGADPRRQQPHGGDKGRIGHPRRRKQVQPAHAAEGQSTVAELRHRAAVEFHILQTIREAIAAHAPAARVEAQHADIRTQPEFVAGPLGNAEHHRHRARPQGLQQRVGETDPAVGLLDHAAQSGMATHPEAAIGPLVQGTHQIARQAVGAITGMAEVAQFAGRRIEPVQAVAGAEPDPAAPILDHGVYRRLRQPLRIGPPEAVADHATAVAAVVKGAH